MTDRDELADHRATLTTLILGRTATSAADAILSAGWRPPNPCDHSGRAVLAPQYQSIPPTFWCQRCGESGLTYPEGYTYPDNKPRQEIPQ